MNSILIHCHMCAGSIVQFGIANVVGESKNFKANGAELMRQHRVEVGDLDLGEAKDLLHGFIERNPQEWYGDIGRDGAE